MTPLKGDLKQSITANMLQQKPTKEKKIAQIIIALYLCPTETEMTINSNIVRSIFIQSALHSSPFITITSDICSKDLEMILNILMQAMCMIQINMTYGV